VQGEDPVRLAAVEDRSGWKLKARERRLHLFEIGKVTVKTYREVRGTPKDITEAGRRSPAIVLMHGVRF
jgi:hypothetical protein